MTQHHRHDAILHQLGVLPAGEELSVRQLAADLAVTAVTIRRDLTRLASRGLLRRTRGGAVSSRCGRIEFHFARRQQVNQDAKAAIAAEAVKLIQPGMNVCLDTGTTTLRLARQIAALAPPGGSGRRDMPGPDLKVLTTSLAIAAELYRRDGIELVLLGGSVRKDSPDMVGPLTEDNLRQFHVHLAFLGADAASPSGLFTADANAARVSRAMIAGAEQAVLLADHSKFEASAFVWFADWPDIDAVITDASLLDETRAWLEQTETRVIVADWGQVSDLPQGDYP